MERQPLVNPATARLLSRALSQAGFTMVEIMVVIILLSILMGIGIPAYRAMVAEQKVRAAAASLHSSLLLARAEAIKLNRTVTLRPAADEDWSDGWLVENPANTVDASALHRDRLDDGGVTITTGAGFVQFRAAGRLADAGGATFELEAVSDSEKKRCVSIGLDGRPTTERGSC